MLKTVKKKVYYLKKYILTLKLIFFSRLQDFPCTVITLSQKRA